MGKIPLGSIQGPKGDPGDTGATGVNSLYLGSIYTPIAGAVNYVGDTDPGFVPDGSIWFDTTIPYTGSVQMHKMGLQGAGQESQVVTGTGSAGLKKPALAGSGIVFEIVTGDGSVGMHKPSVSGALKRVSPVLTNSFEGGTNGTAISTTNSGGTHDAFDHLGGSFSLPTYSTAAAIHGSLGASTPLNGNSTTTLQWKESFNGFNSSSTPWYSRDYVKLATLPSVLLYLESFQDSSVPQEVWAVHVNTAGKLCLRDRLNAVTLATSAGTIAINTPFRYETKCIYDGTTYALTLRIFFGANVEGVTPDETLTGSLTSPNHVDLASFGAQTSTIQTLAGISHDDWGLSALAYMGPV